MALINIDAIIQQTTNDPVTREAMRRQASRLREELSGTAPSAVVKILVDRVIICYFDAYDADFSVAAMSIAAVSRRHPDTRFLRPA